MKESKNTMTFAKTNQRTARLRALLSRRRERGVTLFEVLIVVAILAMIAGGVAFFALPQYQKAQVTTAKSAARIMRQAVPVAGDEQRDDVPDDEPARSGEAPRSRSERPTTPGDSPSR